MKKLISLVRNALSRSVDRSSVGLTFTGERVTIDQSRAEAYAAAIGSNNPRHFKADGVAPPLFASRLLVAPLEEATLSPRLKINLFRLLHGEQAFTFHKPLQYGASLIPSCTVMGIREVGAGDLIEFGVKLEDDSGEPWVTGITTFIVKLGAKARSAAPKESGGSSEAILPDQEGYFEQILKTWPEQPRQYAAASGDHNPIHVHPLAARLAGLPSPIMHGLCVLGMVADALVEGGGGDPAALKELQVRFAKPAFPGSEFALRGRREPDGGCSFNLEDGKGRKILTRGRAVLAP